MFAGQDTITQDRVAIKFESIQVSHPQLLTETKVYKSLRSAFGFPELKWSGVANDYNAIVIQLMDKTLEDLFQKCHSRFSLKTVLMLGDQMLSRVEFFHNMGFIHRDIKPENFMIGFGNQSKNLYLLDFGLSKGYIGLKFDDQRSISGTVRYISVNTHMGIEVSRRDDLESIGYVLLYLLKGNLPWQDITADSKKQKLDLILQKKIIGLESFCQDIEPEFLEYLTLVNKLSFDDKPDYSYYRMIFRNLFIKKGYVYDYVYDWTEMEPKNKTLGNTKSHLDIVKSKLEIFPSFMSVPKIDISSKNLSPCTLR